MLLGTKEITTGWFTNSRNEQLPRPLSKSMFYLDPTSLCLNRGTTQNYSTSRGINGNSNTVSNSPWNVWGFLFPGPWINCCTRLWGRAEEILTGYLAMALHSLISEALFPLQSMSLGSKNWLRLRKWQRTMAFYWGDCPEPLEDPVLVSSDGTSSITSLLDAHLFCPYGCHSL